MNKSIIQRVIDGVCSSALDEYNRNVLKESVRGKRGSFLSFNRAEKVCEKIQVDIGSDSSGKIIAIQYSASVFPVPCLTSGPFGIYGDLKDLSVSFGDELSHLIVSGSWMSLGVDKEEIERNVSLIERYLCLNIFKAIENECTTLLNKKIIQEFIVLLEGYCQERGVFFEISRSELDGLGILSAMPKHMIPYVLVGLGLPRGKRKLY